jgi:WD40 repeat protein
MNALTTATTHPVSHVAFTPDGASFAVAQPNHGVTLHDRASGRMLRTLVVPRVAEFSAVVFLGNGEKLVVGSRRGLHVFDAATGDLDAWYHGWQLERPLLGQKGGALVAATRTRIRVIPFPLSPAVPRDGARGEPFGQVRGVSVLAMSPDAGRVVALREIGYTNRVAVLETASGLAFGTLPDPANSLFLFAPDGSRLAVTDGNAVTVYDLADPEPDDEPDPTPPTKRTRGKGRRAVAPKPGAVLQPVFRLEPAETYPAGQWCPPVAFTPDGRRLLIRRPRNRVQSWDIATGTPAGEWSWRLEEVTCLAVAPDGLTAVAGGRFGRVVVWDLE